MIVISFIGRFFVFLFMTFLAGCLVFLEHVLVTKTVMPFFQGLNDWRILSIEGRALVVTDMGIMAIGVLLVGAAAIAAFDFGVGYLLKGRDKPTAISL